LKKMSKVLLTIIIPTLNRSDFVIRLLNYFADTNYKHCIAIGDSSDSFHVARTKEEIERIGEKLEIIYMEYPGLSCHGAQEKLINLVSTPYIVSLPDDDFLVPDGLDKCIEFLEKNEDYVAAHGLGIIATYKPGERYGRDLVIQNYRQTVVENEDAKERLLQHLESYSVPVFSVHRTAAFRVMWADEIDDYAFGELLPCCLSVILGKIKELKCFYLVRQDHDVRYTSPDSYDWITSSTWQSSYRIFRDCLARELNKQANIPLGESLEIVKRGFWAYLAGGLTSRYGHKYKPNIVAEIKKYLKNVPFINDFLRSFLQSICYAKNRWLSTGNFSSLPALLHPNGPYHNDFMPIYRAITNMFEKAEKENSRNV
jgi:glycosyltransferase domain-containing protein